MNTQLLNFTQECIKNYATYNRFDNYFNLKVSDLPDFVRHEFAAMIMQEDESCAAESTAPDNKHWETKMLPALIRYLKNSTDKDEAIEFNNIWRECVSDYVADTMQECIDEAICDFNYEKGFAHYHQKLYGKSIHGHI